MESLVGVCEELELGVFSVVLAVVNVLYLLLPLEMGMDHVHLIAKYVRTKDICPSGCYSDAGD